MKKVISFSLWGNDPKYTIGAVRNSELAKTFFPDWICRFYIDKNSVPVDIVEKLRENSSEIIHTGEGNWDGMFWRFYAAEDSDIMISRDCDSRLSQRDKVVVDEWLASGRKFHIVRDHPWHTTEILGGLWGVRDGLLTNIRRLITDWCASRPTGFVQVDQNFLRDVVYPMVKSDAFVHDEFLKYNSDAHKINHVRVNKEHLGGVFDANDIPNEEHMRAIP